MKKLLPIMLIVTLLLSMTVQIYGEEFPKASNWALAELEKANKDGFITNRIKNDFSSNITREEFCEIAVILYDRLGGKQDLLTDNPFTDTSNENVIKAYNAEIINGIGNDLFAPNDSLTRQELASMLIRAMRSAGITFSPDNEYEFQKSYADENSISGWAFLNVKIMNAYKIMNGSGENLNPKNVISRQEAVIMLERTYLREFEVVDNILMAYLGNSRDVMIPDGVVSIGDGVFYGNMFIEKVTLPSSVKKIDSNAFHDASNLSTIVLNEGLEIVGEAAFEYAENLTGVILPSTVTKIDFMGFQGCSSLTSMIIPSSVTYIGDQAFLDCANLETITFETDTLEYIGWNAFDECPKLTIVCVEGGAIEAAALEYGIPVSYK